MQHETEKREAKREVYEEAQESQHQADGTTMSIRDPVVWVVRTRPHRRTGG